MKYRYKTCGSVCSQELLVDIDEQGVIVSTEFLGGCPGNLEGISKLVAGMRASDAISRLSGISCGGKDTSCPDQLSIALKTILAKTKE